ncbi:MscL family protein [Metamycoplasma hyosynoviae]|uniref:Mechanosensitive ion channel protein MscL n=1 Tax=Metamycoplasma hyosynoviae TaxID=29559 RepID=A0A063YGR9_9BACT|nr:MscL family protein [Metamycoplasma hyosynoviae]ASI54090.1 mechanosensitive ion channel protein MscL [Metamycoplasma hyosynoviae]KDE41633.1 mechanosensitive ion channel protein MscL [Metamycoplasma hyosynoviae]KDE41730.1 mechanosensitive ion channel protein MscL [Metamycoplasma hyosynoviae]KDE42836.1 mechanosensitive ion channel protein MscL [Metamycoplasma hyosynoviae]KDE43872.1 mechanosensitive ion channel protein MscL [Metamycoplasma hyosynoviae]
MIKKSVVDSWKIVRRGNMFMLAIGLLLGASFNTVISSLANDVIMASIAKLWNASSVESLSVNGILVGKFIGALISFFIVSLVIFLSLFLFFLIKNLIWKYRTKRHPELLIEKPKEPTIEEQILAELKKLNANFNQNKESE